MRIETRNLLADCLLEALDNPEAAAALHCLAVYCKTTTKPPTSVPAEELFSALPFGQRVGVEARLRKNVFLSWEMRGAVEFAVFSPTFTEDYGSIVAKLVQYATALMSWKPDTTFSDIDTALHKGRLLFNHHLFFEVHEILEAQWKQEEGEARLFLQGLIQIAVAFHHLLNNNFRGATALLHEGMAKLVPYQPEFLNMELQNFMAGLDICQQELRRCGPEQLHRFPRELIPSMQLVA